MEKNMEVMGAFIEKPEKKPSSETCISIKADDLYQNWRRVSLSSDFLAKYFSYFFPYREKAKGEINREAAENSISFVLNELIENTAKYSDAENKTVDVHILLLENTVLFSIANYITEKLAESFISLSREILSSNPEELYMKRLEKNIDEGSAGSGLGYLTLINDYGVALGFKFEKMKGGLVKVTVQAQMKHKEA